MSLLGMLLSLPLLIQECSEVSFGQNAAFITGQLSSSELTSLSGCIASTGVPLSLTGVDLSKYDPDEYGKDVPGLTNPADTGHAFDQNLFVGTPDCMELASTAYHEVQHKQTAEAYLAACAQTGAAIWLLRTSSTLSVVLLLLGIAIAPGTLAAQTSLPIGLQAAFHPERNTATYYYFPGVAQPDYVRTSLWFRNSGDEASVGTTYRFQADGAQRGMSIDEHPVGYKPTAICRLSGETTTFFVAGWIPRTGDVLVERWTAGTFALGSAATPGGGTTLSTLITPSYSRETLFVTDSISPILGMAAHPQGDQLILMESGPGHTSWTFNLSPSCLLPGLRAWTTCATPLFDAVTHPQFELVRYSAVRSRRHPTGGQIVFWREQADWHSGYVAPGKAPEKVLVMQDTDLDGYLETGPTLMSFEQLFATYPPGSFLIRY